MLIAFFGPILLFGIMYTAFSFWRLYAQGRLPRLRAWLERHDKERQGPH